MCNHLTALSGSFFVLPNFIDPFADAKLFLTFFENPVVVSIAIIIWCVYFFLIYWARKADRNDIEKVTFLLSYIFHILFECETCSGQTQILKFKHPTFPKLLTIASLPLIKVI